MLHRLRRTDRDESGFTLIELLIVIVILGILAAVVVFAVNGIQDRGTASACKSDVETVTVAAEAYDAQEGRYADSMDQLVDAGFLHSVPSTEHYTVDYEVTGTKQSPSVSVSSASCPDATASGPTSTDPADAAEVAVYCAELASSGKRLNELRWNPYDVGQWRQVLAVFEEIDALATKAMRPNWDVFVAMAKSSRDIIAATGLSQADLDIALYNQVPEGFSRPQLDQLRHDLQAVMGSAEMSDASSAIGTDRQSSCTPA